MGTCNGREGFMRDANLYGVETPSSPFPREGIAPGPGFYFQAKNTSHPQLISGFHRTG